MCNRIKLSFLRRPKLEKYFLPLPVPNPSSFAQGNWGLRLYKGYSNLSKPFPLDIIHKPAALSQSYPVQKGTDYWAGREIKGTVTGLSKEVENRC